MISIRTATLKLLRYIPKLERPLRVSDTEWHRIEAQFYQMIWEYCVLKDIQQYIRKGSKWGKT